MPHPRALGARAALLALLGAAACTDNSPTGPGPGGTPGPGSEGGPATTIAALTCTATMPDGGVTCAPAEPGLGSASGLIVGNQGVYVQLTSSGVNYNSGTGAFTFQTTLQNLIEQPLGTTDGTTLDPGGIRIFFATGPTVIEGTGTAAVIPAGFGFFTAAAQPYYVYPYLLDQGETSPAVQWNFVVQPTVARFVFTVLVSAPVEYPDGYITLDGKLPGASYGALHPSSPHGLTAVVKNAVGVTVPGTVTFGTTDSDCAAVSGTGTVTGVRAGTCSITATSGAYAGELVFSVTGTQRTWNGSASTDWSTGANWNGGYAPAPVDTAVVPTGVPNFPALTAAASIGGVQVADGATLSLGAFDLTASANVATGYTVGSGILGTTGQLVLAGTGRTVQGRVPNVRVTGDYALGGDLHVIAPGRIVSGRLATIGYLYRTVSQ
ncbi:Ig-like domain-containing protein [Longimicrobium sp.]|uniref:Ig-like domain-containing protein n=1 Tax=Longimicrobium sp. TaxID=2029185 RepID=UPI002E30F0BF|nr:Ig-like domain-containing protein [Longimicrobium sp.]HEX6037019.1 Ig-like domain-containing protein [Longimicrobium sp.]